jgi:hypothetical protein
MPRLTFFTALAACLLWITPAPAQPPMVNWTDPLEGAFSCQVPRGWQAEGGMRRVSPLDVRPELLVTSPDGRVLCRLGDAFIRPMVQPNASMVQMGFGEGRDYSPGYGHVFLVLRYLPGARYLTDFYLPNRVGRVSNLKAGQLPNVGRMATQIMAQAGIQMREDAGIVVFDTRTEAGPKKGWGYCHTRAVTAAGLQGGATWEVRYFYGYLADPASEPLARRVLGAMVGSLRYNQQWVDGQLKLAGKVGKIIHNTDTKTFEIIQSVITNRMKVSDRAAQEWDHYIRGTEPMRDPRTGRRYDVQAGQDNYHIGPNGDIVGSQAGQAGPSALDGYQRLEPIPR